MEQRALESLGNMAVAGALFSPAKRRREIWDFQICGSGSYS